MTIDQPMPSQATSPVATSHTTMVPVRVLHSWFVASKPLRDEERSKQFGSNAGLMRPAKRLLDISHPAFRAINAVRKRIFNYLDSVLWPYPEPGVHLIRRDGIDGFTAKIQEFQAELAEAAADLDRHYDELKALAREQLSSLFNPADYPESLVGTFSIKVDFPRVEVPPHVQQFFAELFQQHS